MPRKRAKQSARLAQRSALGYDLPPQAKKRGEWGDTPRRAIELLRGPPPPSKKLRIRKDDLNENAPTAGAKTATTGKTLSIPMDMHIRHGERLKDFNERVEQAFAHDINQTMRSNLRSESNRKKRQRRREIFKEKKLAQDPIAAQKAEEDELDFARAPLSRSLHDVVQAPPTLTARPKERRKKAEDAAIQLPERPKPSAARQRILDEERERVIQQYRAQKHRS